MIKIYCCTQSIDMNYCLNLYIDFDLLSEDILFTAGYLTLVVDPFVQLLTSSEGLSFELLRLQLSNNGITS